MRIFRCDVVFVGRDHDTWLLAFGDWWGGEGSIQKTRRGGTTGRGRFFRMKNATPFAGASRGRFGGFVLARLNVSVPGRETPLSLDSI